jgi:hypothetical protein
MNDNVNIALSYNSIQNNLSTAIERKTTDKTVKIKLYPELQKSVHGIRLNNTQKTVLKLNKDIFSFNSL